MKEEIPMLISLHSALILRENLANEIQILRSAIDTAKAKKCMSLVEKLNELLKEANEKMLELENSLKDSNVKTTPRIHKDSVNLI